VVYVPVRSMEHSVLFVDGAERCSGDGFGRYSGGAKFKFQMVYYLPGLEVFHEFP
jgi:hypothetical protein